MVYLPNRHRAIVPESKILRYLLNLENEDGAAKAEFFLGEGHSRARWQLLAEALKTHALEYEVASTRSIPGYGTMYAIEGMMRMPKGSTHYVRVVWAIDDDAVDPRLITAYSIGG